MLQASASIPGAFPPVMISAQRGLAPDGAPEVFDEMHVDGGVMNPFVALPQMLCTLTVVIGVTWWLLGLRSAETLGLAEALLGGAIAAVAACAMAEKAFMTSGADRMSRCPLPEVVMNLSPGQAFASASASA